MKSTPKSTVQKKNPQKVNSAATKKFSKDY